MPPVSQNTQQVVTVFFLKCIPIELSMLQYHTYPDLRSVITGFTSLFDFYVSFITSYYTLCGLWHALLFTFSVNVLFDFTALFLYILSEFWFLLC